MTTTEPSIEAVKRRPLWRRFAAFVFRWTYRTIGTLTILAGLFVLASRTELVHNWLRDTLLGLANDALEGKINADDIRIDIFHGIVLDRPVLTAAGTTVLSADRISVSYDLAALFVRVAAVNEVRIVKPDIRIIRRADSVWNITKIVKPSPDTTTSAPPDGTLLIRSLYITDGAITVNDRTTPVSDGTWFDPTHQKIRDLYLHLAARIHLSRNDAAIAINGLSFKSEYDALNIEDLKAVIRTSDEGVDIQSLHLVNARNDIALSAKMNGVNLLDGFSDSLFADHPLVATLNAERVYGPDLHYFIADVDLADSYGLTGLATYRGNRIDVDDLRLTAGDGIVNGRVTVDELYGARPLRVDIEVKNSSARYADVKRRLKFVPLPDLPFLTKTTLEYVHLTGHPDDSLWFEVHGQDRPGRVDGEMTLYLSKPTLGYEVDMKIGRGDLSVFSDSSMRTDLNGRVMMVGSGVTLQDLAGTTQIELDRSMFLGRDIRTFRTMIRGDGAGVISIDTVFADLTPFGKDTTSWMDLDESLRQTVALSGLFNASDTARLRYSANINMTRLDLVRLLDDQSMPHRVSGTIAVDAEGIELDKIFGTMSARITQFAMADRAMMPFAVDVESRRVEYQRLFELTSSFGSARLIGTYQPSALIDAIVTSVGAISHNVERRIKHLVRGDVGAPASPIAMQPMEVRVSIDLDETSILNLFLPDAVLSGSALIKGMVTTSADHIETTFDNFDFEYFTFTSDSLTIYTDPMAVSAGYRINGLATVPKLEWMRLKGACDSLIMINEDRLIRPRIEMMAMPDTMSISASTGLNALVMSVAARMQTLDNEAILYLDSAYVNIDRAKGLEWRLIRPSIITVVDRIAHIQDLAVQRPWAETVTITGFVSDSIFRGAVIRVDNFPLRDIPKFAELDAEHPVRLVDGLVTDAVVTINGTYDAPEISAKVNAQDLRYNSAPIGTMQVDMQHRDRTISGTAYIDDPTMKTDNRTLALKVNALPLDIAFKQVDQRLVDNKPIDIELTARKLTLAAIEPFLPAVERVRGSADASIAIKGTTPTDISLSGQGKFEKASFLASSTNMVYNADGVMHLQDSYLILDTINVRNVERDLRGGTAIASGVVVFDGLRVDSVDFKVTTPNKTGIAVMNMASQARSPDIYGDLIVRSGNRPIRMYGKLDSPRLVGDVVVRYSDIVFPKERSTTKARYTTFTYERHDSKRFDQETLIEKASRSRGVQREQPERSPTDSLGTVQTAVASAIQQILEPSSEEFIDVLEYDLDIYLEGRTLLTMIFGTFEILVADLELVDLKEPLTFTGRFGNNSTNMRGKVRVKEGASTYKFYKPFLTSGILNFTSGGMTNPGLDLKAVYEDRRIVPGTENDMEEYKVELTITGTKQKPRIAYRVWRRNREVVGDSAKVAGDALMLILVGKTQDELMSSGEGDLVGQVNAAMSAVATSALSDLVSGIPMIQNAQLDVGSDISQSRLTLSGQLFGDVSYRVSGQISDFSGNSTFTISVPLSVLADQEMLRLFRLDLSQTLNNSPNITRQTRLWEIKLGARLP